MSKFFMMVVLMLGIDSLADTKEVSEPCAKDRETLCSGIKPGDGKLFKCLQSNKDKLSADCKEHQEKMKEHLKEVKEACAGDVQKFCGDLQQGKARILKCLRKHKTELSDACKDEMRASQNKSKKEQKKSSQS